VALAADPENREAARGLKKAETAQQRLEEEGVKAKAQAEQARLRAEAEKGQREREAAEQAKGEAARGEIADAVARAEKHAKAGEFGAAIEAYNVALAADPENREAARGLKKAETAQQRLEEEGVKAKAQAEQARLRAEAEREQREREMADSGSPFAEKARQEAAEREIAVPVERAESHAKAGEPVQAIGVRQVALAADSDDREAAQSIKKMEAALERAGPEETEADAKRPEAGAGRAEADAERPAEKAQGDPATQTDSPSPRPAADGEREPAPGSQMMAETQTTGSAETVAGQTAGTEVKGPAESEKADAKAAANALVAEANALVAEKNYDEALKKIGLALDLDPDNGRAQRLRAKIRKKAGQGEEEGLRTTRREAIVMQRDAQDAYESGDLAQSRQIWARIIEIDPENKLASTMLEESAQEYERQLRDEAQRKEAVEREQAAIQKMNAPVGIETEEPTPLVEFLESLSLITGISFSVAQGADATVNVKVIDKPLHEVLDLVLLPKGLKWTRRTDDVIVVEADLKTAVYNLTTDEMGKVQTLLNNGSIQRTLWGPSGEKPLEGILLDLDERNAILLSVDSAGNQEKLAAFLDQLRKEQPVELLTNFYTVSESDGPQIKALIDAFMRAEKTPYDLERNVSLDGKTLIVRDTPRNIAKIEELLEDREFIRKLKDAKIEFASFSLAPREAMAEDRELSLDFFNDAVEMIETFLYAEEGRAKALEEGRRMWADPSVFQLTITEYPDRIRQVAEFIATMPQLKQKEREQVIRPKYLESGDLATELSDVLGLEEARAEEGAPGAAMVTRSLRTEGELEFRGLNIRVRRVNENDVADEYDDSVELILRSPTQSSEITLNEFMSQYFDDYEIVAEEIRPSGTLGEGRVKLIVRYVPQGLEYVQEEEARAEEERARAAEEEEAPGAEEEGPMKPVIKSFGNQNAIIVRYEDPADLIKIKNLVAELDRPIPQVSIETRFVTVNEQRAKEFSSEFAFLDKGDPRNIGWGFIDTAEIPRAGRDEIQPVSGRMVGEIWRDALNGGFGDYTLLDGVLHNFLGNYVDWELTLLEVEGVISFVNGPHIVVMDGETASFVITNGATSLPRYYEGGLLNPGLNVLPATGLTTAQNQAQTQNQNIGQDQGFNQGQQGQDQSQVLLGTRDLVSLDVEPQVTSPESILLEIDVVITDNGFHWNSYRGPWGGEASRNYAGDFFSRARPDRRRSSWGLVTAAGATTPIQAMIEEPMEAEFRFNPDMGGSRKEVETRARIKDGGTIVLGGWTGEFSQDMTTGVPGLRNLPLLGKLFFSKNYYSTQKTNLLCFLSGHLVD
jgi:tetratricopeptide (TPR) repeat protein/Flp pilus assembly secretin CpaC